MSKGHDYDRNAFMAMFDAMNDVQTALVEHPAVSAALQPPYVDVWDAVLFYDMCGIPGVNMPHDGAGGTGEPPAGYVRAIEALLAARAGIVLLNHATVSWPRWPLWREITGSSFMLAAGFLGEEELPGSGYRGGHGPLPNETVALLPQQSHPVLAGLEAGFSITDELYLKTSGYESEVLPLLRADFAFVEENFTPPPLAPPPERAAWHHPPGSNLVAWANACRGTPVVVSDLGDGPLAYGNDDFRRLLENALKWVASGEARAWAVAG